MHFGRVTGEDVIYSKDAGQEKLLLSVPFLDCFSSPSLVVS